MDLIRLTVRYFRLWKRVTFEGEFPEETSLRETFIYIRAIGIFPSKPSEETFSYTVFNSCIMLLLISFVLSITFDLYDASSDFVTLGDDICVLVGLYLILTKVMLFRIYKPNIERIWAEYESFYAKFKTCSEAVRGIQRHYFIQENLIFYFYLFVGNSLFIAVCFQPLLSGQFNTLPFRAKFPFSLENRNVFIGAYVFQFLSVLVYIKSILHFDNIGCIYINQTSVNLKIVCQRMREFTKKGITGEDLGEIIHDHQRIINLVEYITDCFYWNYVAQIGASTFLICLTAFEAQLASDQPMVALKFQIFMFSSFTQLLYWSWVGNKVRYDSLDVATAAYECGWIGQTNQFRRDLMFVIQRAQEPLSFRAQPLYGYDFESFSAILSSSYSYFTLLRTLMD